MYKLIAQGCIVEPTKQVQTDNHWNIDPENYQLVIHDGAMHCYCLYFTCAMQITNSALRSRRAQVVCDLLYRLRMLQKQLED